MISRCYLEITNVCNLDCVFCPKTARAKRSLTLEQFDALTTKLQGEIRFLYFHLMGEPTLHRHLPQFVRMARAKGFVPVLTTNGTLLADAAELALAGLHKVQISLHSHEGNRTCEGSMERYMAGVMAFALRAASCGTLVVLRLWNQGGCDSANEQVLRLVAEHLPEPWTERYDGWKVAENIYIEYDREFEWSDEAREECGADQMFCYALRNQIGVLVDGSVVPCCLDHDGAIVLGNLFVQPLSEIVASPRARALYDGFTRHEAVEPLCRRCGYAAHTKHFRKAAGEQ